MKPDEVLRTYKEIKRELSTIKDFYTKSKINNTIEKEKLEEYKNTDKILLKEVFWYIKRLKKSLEKIKVNYEYTMKDNE